MKTPREVIAAGIGSLRRPVSPPGPRAGFTLIELLIVIAIIVVMAGLITGGITIARKKASIAEAKHDINVVLKQAISAFNSDTGYFPGGDLMPDDDGLEEFNAFPSLYEAVCGEKPPDGGGGPHAPYAELKHDRISIEDPDSDTDFTMATSDERYDRDIPKYYLDPWDIPYFYRENHDKRRKRPWMIHRHSYDLWSAGPDKENEACLGPAETETEYDDIVVQ
ncbi:MAG: type II secretion system protein [Planctomycetota bacterium]